MDRLINKVGKDIKKGLKDTKVLKKADKVQDAKVDRLQKMAKDKKSKTKGKC